MFFLKYWNDINQCKKYKPVNSRQAATRHLTQQNVSIKALICWGNLKPMIETARMKKFIFLKNVFPLTNFYIVIVFDM